jgi:hypothetical protein
VTQALSTRGGGGAAAVAAWRRQLGGGSLVAATWRRQLGGGSLAVAALSAKAAAATFKIKPTLDNTLVDIILSFVLS